MIKHSKAPSPVSRRSFVLGAGAAVAGAALLSACGSDSSDKKGSANGGDKLVKMHLGGYPAAAFSSYKLAVEEKAFEKAGIEVSFEEFADAGALYTAYRAGRVDGGLSGIPSVANLVATGVDRKVVFGMNRTTNGILVRSDSDIASLSDIKGKKIALFGGAIGSSVNMFFSLCREFFGVNPTKDCEVQYGAPDLIAELLVRGEVDLALTLDPAGVKQVVAGSCKYIGDQGVVLEERLSIPAIAQCWDFSSKYIDENPEAVEAFKRINLDYQTRFNNDQSLWDAALKELYGISDQKILDTVYQNQKGRQIETWGDTEKDQVATLLEFLSKNGEPDFLPKIPSGLFA